MLTYKPVTDYTKGIGQKNTGLGNQMFQVAATIGIAIKNNTQWRLPEWEHPFLGDFGEPVDPGLYKTKDIPWGYHDVKISKDRAIRGYLQSEKYFEHCEGFIRDLFAMPPPAYSGDFIAVHIRRGDYKKFPEHHTLLGKDYYDKALSLCPDLPIIVFTDDALEAWDAVPKADLIYTLAPFNDFNLMTTAKYHVIANSSFSWWGAWLARGEKVIAPRDWFGSKKQWSTEDLYCKNWIVI